MKNLFIVNPNAGTRQAKQHLPDILEIFGRHGGLNHVYITSKRGDAVKFTADHAESADRIICIGGDGTLNEVITGLQTGKFSLPVGYIPAGTANDFANSLDISKNMISAAENIIKGKATPVDIGRFIPAGETAVNRYFSYIASFGAFTRVSYNTPQSSKNMLGHLAYVIEGIKELPNIRPEYIKIETAVTGALNDAPNNFEGEYIFGAVMNSKSVGGILSVSPGAADMSDGLFEVMLIKPLNNPKAVLDCAYSLISQNYNSEYISFFKANKITVRPDPDLKWSLDGERENGGGSIVIENLRHAVSIIKR